MPQTKKILWIASVFLWLLPSRWQNPFFLLALGLLFNDTLKHVLKFRWHLKALLTLIGLKHLFMVNCVLSGLFLKEKKRWIDLGMCLNLSRCLSALQSWGLRTECNPLKIRGWIYCAACPVQRNNLSDKMKSSEGIIIFYYYFMQQHPIMSASCWQLNYKMNLWPNGPTQNLFKH